MELKRTHYCSDLRVEDVDRDVVLMGWCKTRRDHGGEILLTCMIILGLHRLSSKWKSVRTHMY